MAMVILSEPKFELELENWIDQIVQLKVYVWNTYMAY